MNQQPSMGRHLPDETLNEYLDETLDHAERTAVEAHLAECRACARRLGALRSLFASLATLPEMAIQRDLSASVVTALRRRGRAAQPAVWRGRRSLGLVFVLQAVAALLLLAFAWPALAGLATRLPIPSAATWLTATFGDVAASVARLSAPAADPLALWRALEHRVAAGLTAPLPVSLQPPEVALALAAAAAIWLFGNALLLSRPLRVRLRRRS